MDDTDQGGVPAARTERRKSKTRTALVRAARGFLMRPDYLTVSIADIAEAADVGLGSFYNHFDSKDELFATAVNELLAGLTDQIRVRTVGITDPAIAAAIAIDATMGLVDTQPDFARIIGTNGLRVLDLDTELTPRALEIIRTGISSGRFVDVDEELLLAILGGGLVGALHSWQQDPERTGAWSTRFIERLLVSMGVSEADARHIVAELPE